MQPLPARAAYDAIAAEYDDRVVPSSWVRGRVWERLDALFPPGSRVLDVTAGTGLDARHLAARGVAVTACDLSPGMLDRLVRKAPDIPSRVADFNRLDEVTGPFDGVISTFAGLNAAADLSGLARAAARLARPGGFLFLHVLGRWRRGLRRGFTMRIAGVDVPHRLWTPRELAQIFAADFSLLRVRGYGIVRPVNDDGRFARRDGWERAFSAIPTIRGFGTFFSAELVRRG